MSEFRSRVFSQKRVELDGIFSIVSSIESRDKALVSSGINFILVDDSHLKALLSLYVKDSDLLRSSACVLCSLVPVSVSSLEGYYINRKSFLFRIFQRFFDFLVHIFKPFPRRIYSKSEESHFIELKLFQVLGVILERFTQLGLSHEIMLDIDRDRVAKVLGVPRGFRVQSMTAVGYEMEPGEAFSCVKVLKNFYS
jgi:hypothetical protein